MYVKSYIIQIVSVLWRKPVLAYAVSVIIPGFGEFGEICVCYLISN